MKIFVIVFLFSLAPTFLFSQNQIVIISEDICDCLNQMKSDQNTLLSACLESEFKKEKYLKLTDSVFNEVQIHVFEYLAKNCPGFEALANKEFDQKGNEHWKWLDAIPESEISVRDFKGLFKHKILYYYESSGTLTELILTGKFWTDKFADGTFSKCMVSNIGDREFEIVFMESTNRLRNRIAKKGDTFRYTILKKTDSYYLAVATYEGFHGEFKIYHINPEISKSERKL